jgi:hypothetical protein
MESKVPMVQTFLSQQQLLLFDALLHSSVLHVEFFWNASKLWAGKQQG